MGYPSLFDDILGLSLSGCQLDNSCPVTAWESLHTTVWMLLFWCILTVQCIKFVLLPLKVTVENQNMQRTLSFACIFKFMSLNMHKKNLNMKCILIWQICKNMHPHRAQLCWLSDGATMPRSCKWAWVWLGWLRRLACCCHSAAAPSVAEAMEVGFLPALDGDQADMFTDTLRTTCY